MTAATIDVQPTPGGGPIPLWPIVASAIVAEIHAGILQPGDVLPTGEVLAGRHGVSRATVQRAIGELIAAGVADPRRGKAVVTGVTVEVTGVAGVPRAAAEPRPPTPATTRDNSWRDDALCAQTDPTVFFPDKGESPTAARRVCFACPVRRECLTHAVAAPEPWGVWGGLTARQRRRLTRGRAAS